MTEVVRLIDCDEISLEERLARALEALSPGHAVARFTYWYTGRPPVHEAVVTAPSPPA